MRIIFVMYMLLSSRHNAETQDTHSISNIYIFEKKLPPYHRARTLPVCPVRHAPLSNKLLVFLQKISVYFMNCKVKHQSNIVIRIKTSTELVQILCEEDYCFFPSIFDFFGA